MALIAVSLLREWRFGVTPVRAINGMEPVTASKRAQLVSTLDGSMETGTSHEHVMRER